MKSIGIYIHIPFCEQKCPYCDFYSIADKNEFDRYTDAVIDRIKQFSDKYNRTVSSVYFGGGTPSVIGTNHLVRILESVKSNFELSADAEVTVEVNPCSQNNISFEKLFVAGFNRISIGLQSANENELKILGRRHDANDAKNTVDNAKKVGFKNISLDLMLCVPEQTKSSLTKSIEFCRDCNVTHISAYILKIEENTKFYQIKDKLILFDDDETSQIYIHAVNELERCGYCQYEISNFCKPSFEGKHNLKYWRDEEYIGIGPSAHSFIDGKRFYYSRSFEDFYSNKITEDGTGGDIEECIMLRLRLKEGLTLDLLKNEYGYTPSDKLIKSLNRLNEEGLIKFDNNLVSLTKEGFLVSNMIINYIIDAL